MAVRMSTGGRRVDRYYATEDTYPGPSLCGEQENKKFLKLQKRLRDFQGYMKKRLQQLCDERGEDNDDEEIEDLRSWLDISNNPSADAEFGIEMIEETVTDLLNYFREHPIMTDDEDEEMSETNRDVPGKEEGVNEEPKREDGQGDKIEVDVNGGDKNVDSSNDAEAVTAIAMAKEENVMIRNPLGPEVHEDQRPPDPRPSLLSGTRISPVGAGRGVRRMDQEDRNDPRSSGSVLQSNGLHGLQDAFPQYQVPHGMNGFVRMPQGYMMHPYGVYPPHPGFHPAPPMMNGFYGPRNHHHKRGNRHGHGRSKHRRPEQRHSEAEADNTTDDQFMDAASETPMSESESTRSVETIESVPGPDTEISEAETSASFKDFAGAARRCFTSNRRTPKKQNTDLSRYPPLHQTPHKSSTSTRANIATTSLTNDDSIDDNGAKRRAIREMLNKDIFTQLFRVGQKQKISEEFEAQPERGRRMGKTPRKDKPTVTPSKSKTDQVARKSTGSLPPPPRQRSKSVGPENPVTPRKSVEKERTRKSPKVALPFPRISNNKRNRVIYTSSEEDSDSEHSEESYQPQRDRRSRSVSRGPTNRRSKSIPRRFPASPKPSVLESPEEQERKKALLLEYLTQLGYSQEDINEAVQDQDLYARLTVMLHDYIPALDNNASAPTVEPESPVSVQEPLSLPLQSPAPVGETELPQATRSSLSPPESSPIVEPEFPQVGKSPSPPPHSKTPTPLPRRLPSPDPSIISLPDPREPPTKKFRTGKKNLPVYRPQPSITSGGYGEDTDDDTLSLISLTSTQRRAVMARGSSSSETQYRPPDAFVNTATDKVKVETDYGLPTVKVEND